MGSCAADFISTCRKEHRQHLRLENFQHKLYSVHNEVCFKSTLFSSLPLHTHLTRITVSNLTPDPSNKAESLSLRDQHLMLLKINYFSTVDINSILEQKPFRQTEVAESVQLTSHPLGCSLSPSAWTSPQHGRKQTIWPLTWIQPLSRTFF